MEKFTVLEAVAAALPTPDIDTDMIIRIERCVRTPRAQMGRWAFEMARYRPDGSEDPAFPLNQERFRGAQILVAAENFGCGSSREMAVWAIAGMGFRCVIAPSFGEIFYGNCFQNGVLAIRLPAPAVAGLLVQLGARSGPAKLRVDLPAQSVAAPGGTLHRFEIDPLRKKALLEGLDAIGMTFAREAEIAAWQAADRRRRPWVWG
ncbi:MAG TPA: 3-isopropylmalate dehydratase small subunit [Burkholderiales bacterium]|nr:3-isopropylmalate dehydratase small subunit [Burkholderiales bacterium]